MIRQTEDEMREIAKHHENTVIKATKVGAKWTVDLVITNYATIRMRSARKPSREFGNIDSLMKACTGMAKKVEIDLDSAGHVSVDWSEK